MSLYSVILRAKSCAHFPEGHSAQARHVVQPSGETVEVLMLSEYIGAQPGDLIAVVTGPGNNPEDAVARLASFGISLMDMLSAFTGAMVHNARLSASYSLSFDEEARPFRQVVSMQSTSAHPCMYRVLTPALFLEAAGVIMQHPLSIYLKAASSKLAECLRHKDPLNAMIGGNFLYMAAESLGNLRTQELLAQHNVARKHDLAVALNYPAINQKGGRDLNKLDSDIRCDAAFGGDRQLYELIRSASDRFEHGSNDMAGIQQDFMSSFERAYELVRRSLIATAHNHPDRHILLDDPVYQKPLEGWLPQIVLQGNLIPQAQAAIEQGVLIETGVELGELGRARQQLPSQNASFTIRVGGQTRRMPVELNGTTIVMPGYGKIELQNQAIEVDGKVHPA